MRNILSVIGLGAFACLVAPLVRAEQEAPQPGSVIPSGDIRARNAFYSVVFYFTPEPKAPVLEAVQALLADKLPGVPLVTEPKEAPKPAFVAMEREVAPLENYPVPDAPYLERWGIGIKGPDAAAVQASKEAVRLILIVPKDSTWEMAKRFTELTGDFAQKTGAFIWDSATRQFFSAAAWRERRIEPWTGAIPDVSDQITIHAYRVAETNYVRAITLGMEKFALPDLVIQQMLASETRSGGNLINVTAQLLAEEPVIEHPGEYHLRLAALKNEAVSKMHRKNLLKGATEEARLALVIGRPEDGDPDNPLVELDFRNGVGRSNDERRQATFAQIWGSADTLIGVRHNEAILAASKAAKAKLPALQKIFARGLAPGERIILKAPFARDDGEGNEWMWVEILKWPAEGKATGILQNEPHYVKKLRAGSRVLIKPEEVFDYVYYKTDGTKEGNETGRLMQQQTE